MEQVAEFDWNSWYKERKEELYKITSHDQSVQFQLNMDKFVIEVCLKSPLLYDILDMHGKNWKRFFSSSSNSFNE